MNYLTAYNTNPGTAGKINQDSLGIQTAKYNGLEYIFFTVCDGVGGLDEGEKASSYITEMLCEWFQNDFSALLRKKSSVLEIRHSLDEKLHYYNDCLNRYASNKTKSLGTTVTAVLTIPSENKILVVNVGDSRLYKITSDQISIITHDHSVVGEKLRRGMISEERAAIDPKQNQITKCIGAGFDDSIYDFHIIDYQKNCCYMLCTDGFRKKITKDEIFSFLNPDINITEDDLKTNLRELIDLNIKRNETDNITAVIVKILS